MCICVCVPFCKNSTSAVRFLESLYFLWTERDLMWLCLVRRSCPQQCDAVEAVEENHL